MPAESFFIPKARDDGYTLEGFVPRLPGLYPDFHYRYRAALPEERDKYNVTRNRTAEAQRIIAEHLIEVWEPGGQPVRVVAEQIAYLHANLRDAALDSVLGFRGPVVIGAAEGNGSPPASSS
jgi:hypothetical protein